MMYAVACVMAALLILASIAECRMSFQPVPVVVRK